MMQILTQLLGLAAVAMIIGSYQCASSRNMFIVTLFANVLYILHFLLLGAYTGCVSMVINLLRNVVLINKKPWAQNKIWMWIFLAAGLAATALTWDGIISIFPMIATAAFTVSSFTKNGKKIRIINSALGSPSWIIYDIFTHSWGGLLGELICLGSVVVSVLRYGWKALDVDE